MSMAFKFKFKFPVRWVGLLVITAISIMSYTQGFTYNHSPVISSFSFLYPFISTSTRHYAHGNSRVPTITRGSRYFHSNTRIPTPTPTPTQTQTQTQTQRGKHSQFELLASSSESNDNDDLVGKFVPAFVGIWALGYTLLAAVETSGDGLGDIGGFIGGGFAVVLLLALVGVAAYEVFKPE